MNGGVKIGRIFGISIKLHYTWFLIFALLAWSLAIGYFPVQIEGKTSTIYWLMGGFASLLLFASVLLHELSHSVIALKNKIKVSSITLFFFGGVAEVSEDAFSPNKELKIAIAGPIMSMFLALCFFLLTKITVSAPNAVFSYLAWVNFLLGAFNLVPGFPLDGGRVLRAILWKKWGDLNKATYFAAEGGKAFGILLIVMGVLGIFWGKFNLWYVLIGFFIYSIAKNTYKFTIIRSALKDSKVRDVMAKSFKTLDANSLVKNFDFKKYLKYDQWAYPVALKKKIIGIALQQHIEKAKTTDLKTKISAVTIPLTKIKSVEADDSCIKAYELMTKQNLELLPVMKNKKVIGVVKAAMINELFNMAASKIEIENKARKKR
ncbi:MAG: site-2 protease family protein [Nanoarchaeota archaeon]|nr:site-2 protease family protein [Nanoarchaeota archaeon]